MITFKQIQKLTSILSLIAILGVGSSFSKISTTADESAQISQEKQQVESQIGSIQSTLDSLVANYSGNAEQKSNLNSQISEKRKKISDTDKLITDTRLVVGQIEKQQTDLQAEIKTLDADILRMYMDLQINYNPLKVIVTGKDLGSIMSKFLISSDLTTEIQNKRNKKVQLQDDLEATKQNNLKLQEQLEESRALLKSEESNLDALLTTTNGQESKYQQLLNSIAQQKIELEAQLGNLEGEYISELQDLREDERLQNVSATNCRFEETATLDVPRGYFGKPANGVLTQGFHCGHDGIDVADRSGAELYSIADGVVDRVGSRMDGCVGLGCNGGFGNYIVIKHTIPNGDRVYSLYAHLKSQPILKVGQSVGKGSVVGLMGCTGFTKPYPCGVHIHFVMLSQKYEQTGLGCRLGRTTCYNPLRYISY